MEIYKFRIKSGLMLIATTLISTGFFTGTVYAGDKDEQARLVFVDCDKGQDLQDVIWQYLDDKKPLEIIVKGTCGEGPDEAVLIERDNVRIEGDEDLGVDIGIGGYINAPLFVDGARNIEIDDNMKLLSLYIRSGEVSIEAEAVVTIENEVFIIRQSSLSIDTASDDDDGVITTGLVTVNGAITLEGHSLLSVQSNVFEGQIPDGQIYLNGMAFARLQSSMDLSHATVNDLVLEFDSHALLGEGLLPALDDEFSSITFVTCDQQSRAWGESPDGFFFNNVVDTRIGETCDSFIP